MLCYYLGMFSGRLSISCFKLNKISITLCTVMQFVNCCFFWQAARYEYFSLTTMMIVMWTSGLYGGLSYGNCYYRIVESKKLEQNQRELAVNFGGFMTEIGILCSCIAGLILQNTILKKD